MVTPMATPLMEADVLSAWLAKAAPHPDLAADVWRLRPTLPRRLHCGVVFDVVLCHRILVEAAYRILAGYEQPLGPALILPQLDAGAILVPRGTDARWPELIAATQWPERVSRPACLGNGHAIQVPAPAPASASSVGWLQEPEVSDEFPPHLTSPVPLARCLAEARAEVQQRPEHRGRAHRVRSVLPGSWRTR
ncbi:hypothetical protein OG352_13760 [Streptomyces sp. NBC_01485]|uniref:hypothetical protein n=1 Tax=Streptomyces sp. NBC_01485 TaxID=2903884 RepID=UPI002E31D06E|nr:hypothetical protein [Streptomyces sp. NBC_01485]